MVMRGNTGKVQRATSAQDRMDILAEVAEAVRGTAMEWLRAYAADDADEGILHGARVSYVWQTDGSVLIAVDDEVVMRAAVQITVEPVEVLDAPPAEPATNEPIGGEIQSQWGKVPSGWFVKTPKGEWLEVGNTSLATATGKQMVSLKMGDTFHVFPRDPRGEVWARRGSLAPRDRDDAMASLEEAFTTAILRDDPPWAP